MAHKAWSSIEEVPYYFSRSYIKFQGHTGQKIADFDPNWAFPDCNCWISPMDLKWFTKLDILLKRCSIVLRGHPSNLKATQAEKSNLSKITRLVAAIESLRFALLYQVWLTHWGQVTHKCISKLTINGSDNGLSPGWCQAIIWTSAGILSIGPLWTNFSEILIGIQTFSFKKMHLKMLSGKWRPFFSQPQCVKHGSVSMSK